MADVAIIFVCPAGSTNLQTQPGANLNPSALIQQTHVRCSPSTTVVPTQKLINDWPMGDAAMPLPEMPANGVRPAVLVEGKTAEVAHNAAQQIHWGIDALLMLFAAVLCVFGFWMGARATGNLRKGGGGEV